MEKAKIKISTVGKIFNFLKKEKGEEVPSVMKYLTGGTEIEIAKENLSVTKFNNGDPIPEAKTEEEWIHFGKEKSPGFMRYGKHLHYNHFAVTDERGICPSGWRVPTQKDLLFIKYRKLYRTFPLVGYRNGDVGSVRYAGSDGFYWSSTVVGSEAGYLGFDGSSPNVGDDERAHGLLVRCVRDKK